STITFSNFGQLTGGTGNDTFTFTDGKSVSVINGGTGGTNILDLSNYTTALTINLSGYDFTGYSGTSTGTPNPMSSFAGITQLNGGSGSMSLATTNVNTTVTLTGNN